MVGSKRDFGYRDGNGRFWAVKLDESTYESGALDFNQGLAPGTPYLTATSTYPLRMRKVNCFNVDGDGVTVRRSFYVGTATALNNIAAAGQVTVSGETWAVSSVTGERLKAIPKTDSGLLDGDIDNQLITGGTGI
jgi:hypothetical protein